MLIAMIREDGTSRAFLVLITAIISGYAAVTNGQSQQSNEFGAQPAKNDNDGAFYKMCERPLMAPGLGASPTRHGVGFDRAGYWPGTELRFYCSDPNFDLYPKGSKIFCTKEGKWAPDQVPVCFKAPDKYESCTRPRIANGAWECKSSDACMKLLTGMQVKVMCDDNYDLSGPALVKCQSDGRWSPQLPTCVPRQPTCPPLPPVLNGTFHCITENCLQYNVKAMVDVVCDQGFGLMGTPTLSCLDDLTWSSRLPQCILLQSPTCVPFKIQHGQWEVGGYHGMALFGAGASITYHCDTGYRLVGESRLVCRENSGWTSFPPKCDPEILCPDPGPIDNGRFECADINQSCQYYSVGTTLVFVCDDGYHRVGSHEIKCVDIGLWSAAKPWCSEVSSTTAPVTSRALASTTTVVIVTACSVLGVLMFLMLGVAMYRRRPQRCLAHQIEAPPPPYSQTCSPPPPPSDLERNQDRLALIAYDGVSLPSYDEAIATPTSRRTARPYARRQSDALSRHSVLTNSTTNRDPASVFGSSDTVNLSTANLSTVASTDNTSTSVTLDTYDSGASVPSIAMTSRRAVAGSLASTSDTSSVHKEESPLLELTPDDPHLPSQDVELEEFKDD